ncbi:DUF3592 domain-containing protein [Porcipelethomonas sp.]|uniref:DUF3592 domain-containing protein n=1 Tax=Porcipelethomonas sp. TaxID=2981675 RepID=UPI003EF2E02E
MEKIILISPVIIGMIIIIAGILIHLNRTRFGIHTMGTITGIEKSIKKVSRVETVTIAPIVKYTVNGKEYSGVSYKFFPEDAFRFQKGKAIKIRISRKNPRHFVPEEDGTAEKILISCGLFMIIAVIVMYFRYY